MENNINQKIVYKPEGAVGIRYKKQIFNNKDLANIGFSSHVLESVFRKKHFLTFFDSDQDQEHLNYDDYLVSEVCPSNLFNSVSISNDNFKQDQQHENHYCSQDMPLFTYLSTNYYKPRNDYIQNPFKNETFLWGGIQIQSTDSLHSDFPRDNSYLNYALGVKNSYELPLAPMEEIEVQQIIETFLYKKAITHNRDNFFKFMEIFGAERVQSQEIFQKFTYTYNDPEQIANLTNGLKPIKINSIIPNNSLFKFFHNDLEITPSHTITYDQCQLLIPKRSILTIDNLSKIKPLIIKEFRTTSPELTPYLPKGKDFPIKLGPLSSLEIQLVFLPETLGLFEAAFYVVINDLVFVGSVNAFVIPNQFDLEPIYVTDVTVNQKVEIPVHLTNPLPNTTLLIEELWSTDRYAQLYWPNGEMIPQSFDSYGNGMPAKDPLNNSDFMKIAPLKESHTFNIVFQVNLTQDHYTEIQIRTSLHDIIRLPVYFHVHSDVMKFTPSIVDFGIVPLNFDLLKISVKGKNNAQEPLRINDIYVPISDNRLDFLMVESRTLEKGNPIKPGQDLFLGYALLSSNRPGLILQKIIINATGLNTNHTYKIELPIIANVMKSTHTLQSLQDSQITSSSQDFTPPIVTFDISDYIINQSLSRMLFVIPQYRPVILSAPLILKNTFGVPISIKGIINNNKELKVNLLPGINQEILYQELVLQPNETIKFAQVEVLTTALKITQGLKFISIQINNTFVPAAIQIYDRHLTCVWEEQQKSRFLQCAHGYDMNFGYVPTSEPKIKRLNITNLNPHNITIENVLKSQIDDMIVFVDKYFDKNGKQLSFSGSKYEERECKMNLMTQKRTKKIVNLTLQPYQTVCLIFQVYSREPKQKSSRIEFQTRKKETSDFSFNYSYQVLEGNLTIVPQILRFHSGSSGTLQSKPLIARSTFDVPIVIKQISSTDMRIFPQFTQQNSNIIMPRNKTEIGSITFDSNRAQNNILLNSFENAMFGQTQAFDSSMSQHIMQLLNGGNPSNNGQITMIMNQGQQIQINSMGNQNSNQLGQKSFITANDLILYRDKQKTWDDLGTMGKTEINTIITIETNVFQNITVQVRAHLTKPSIIVDDIIDFDTVQIGTLSMRSIKIVNPSEEPLIISLFLTNQPLNKANELNYKQMSNQTNEWWNEIVANNTLSKGSFISTYCNNKIKQPENKTDQDNDIKELFLGNKVNQLDICLDLANILNSQDMSEESKGALIQNMEAFYQSLLEDEGQSPGNNQFHNLNKNIMQLNKDLIKRQQSGIELNQANFKELIKNINNSQNAQTISVSNVEIDTYAAQINKVSSSRFIDQYTINMMRINERANSKGFYENFKNLFANSKIKNEFQYRQNANNSTYLQQQQLQQSQMDAKNQKRYRLKNFILNEIIINNDTSRFNTEYVDVNTQKPLQISNQSFYINPKIQGVQFRVDPRSNLTIREALIFQPQSIQTDQLQMNLIIKNNLTHLYQVELVGSSGTGLIEFTKVLKKSLNSENYINVQNIQSNLNQFLEYGLDNENVSNSITQSNIRERILTYIYGEKDYFQEPKNLSQNYRKYQDLEKFLFFNIAVEDMIVIQDIMREDQESDYQTITDLLSHKYQNIKLNSNHKRIFVAQNSGNLPVQIDSISIEGKGCKAFGITIVNCHSFTLKPGEQHQIHISYQTDFTIGKLRKSLILESKYFIQEFTLQIQLPMALLPLANQILPLTTYEETFFICLKFMILGGGMLSLFYVSKDVVNHFQFKHDQLDQEKLDNQLQQEMFFKINSPIKHKELPIMRDMLGHDQIFTVFQSAQEKFDNPNQLLLKEITNICSKKNLICIEAQKQAIDAEKERRMNQRQSYQQNMTISKYLERKDKEDIQQQVLQQRSSQHESNMQFQQTVGSRHQESAKLLNSIEDSQKIIKQLNLIHVESKESTITDNSINDSFTQITSNQTKIVKENSQKATEERPKDQTLQKDDKLVQQQNLPEQIAPKDEDQLHQLQTQPQQKVSRLSKKQKRETAQRIKEQQELEERFRLAQKRKEEELIQEKKRREIEISRARELSKRAEEELKRQKEEELAQAALALKESKETWEDLAPSSSNLSAIEEKDNSLNLSQVQKESLEFKQSLSFIGELPEQRLSFISVDREITLTKKNTSVKDQKKKKIESLRVEGKLKDQIESEVKSIPRIQEIEKENKGEEGEAGDTHNEINLDKQDSKASQDYDQHNEFVRKRDYSEQDDDQQNRKQGNNFQTQQLSYAQGQNQVYNRKNLQGANQQHGYYQQQINTSVNQTSYRPKKNQQQLTQGQNTHYKQTTQYQSYSNQGRGQSVQAISSHGQQQRRVFDSSSRGSYGGSQTSIRGRGRGYYKNHNVEYEEDEAEYQQQNYYQPQYTRKQYAKDEYEDEHFDEQRESYYRQRFQKKQNFTSQDENDEYGSQEEEHSKQRSDTKTPQQQEGQRSVRLVKVKETKPDDYESQNEEEKHRTESDQSQQNDKGQLSKDDLKPFFESQKKPEESLQKSKRGSILGSLVSPNQVIGSSIFSFNPCSIFSQQNSQNLNIQRDQSPEYAENVNQIIDDEGEEDQIEEKKSYQFRANQHYQQQRLSSQNSFGATGNQTTDFYNTFKSASSLFSKPLFGATVLRQNEPKHSFNQVFRKPSFEKSQIYGEEDEQEEEPGDTSLFSGSLFGDSGPFSQQRRNSKYQAEEETQVNMRGQFQRNTLTPTDDSFFPPPGLAPIQGTSGSSFVNPNQYQPQYFPQQYPNPYQHQAQDNQSLFGNAFGMNFRSNYVSSPGLINQADMNYFQSLPKQTINYNIQNYKEPENDENSQNEQK